MNDADFNSPCLSNAKNLVSETLLPKKKDLVSFDKNVIRMQSHFHLLQHRLPLPHLITQEKKYLFHHQVRVNFLPQNYIHHLVLITRNFVMFK